MALLQISPYNIKRFNHSARDKMLVTEASNLNWMPGEDNFKPLFVPGSIGIALSNPRTGSTTYWYYVAEARDCEGDLTHWILHPTHESCRKHPGVQCYTMHILND